MNTPALRWYDVPREDLPEVLFGLVNAKGLGATAPEDLPRYSKGLFVGYSSESAFAGSDYIPPAIAILSQEEPSEFLSWVRTFASEAFPLSQFCRVLSLSDFNMFREERLIDGPRSDAWASVVVSEALAQASDGEIQTLPLNRSAGCLSNAVARADLIHGASQALRVCAERLRSIESDKRLNKKNVTVDELAPCWTIARTGFGRVENDLFGVLGAIRSAIEQSLGQRVGDLEMGASSVFRDDSIEKRVLAFETLLGVALQRKDRYPKGDTSIAFQLAAAALLVGRSTSHAFLLSRVRDSIPLSYVWFGVIAGLLGPRFWDNAWSRAVKGVELQLRSPFNWSEQTACDISWPEYAWLASPHAAKQSIGDLARISPRAITIEIVPGVPCQFRIVGVTDERSAKSVDETDTKLSTLRKVLDEMTYLVEIGRRTIGGQDSASRPQGGLFESDSKKRAGRQRKPSKGR